MPAGRRQQRHHSRIRHVRRSARWTRYLVSDEPFITPRRHSPTGTYPPPINPISHGHTYSSLKNPNINIIRGHTYTTTIAVPAPHPLPPSPNPPLPRSPSSSSYWSSSSSQGTYRGSICSPGTPRTAPSVSPRTLQTDLTTSPITLQGVLSSSSSPSTFYPASNASPSTFPASSTSPSIFPAARISPRTFQAVPNSPSSFPAASYSPNTFQASNASPSTFAASSTSPSIFPAARISPSTFHAASNSPSSFPATSNSPNTFPASNTSPSTFQSPLSSSANYLHTAPSTPQSNRQVAPSTSSSNYLTSVSSTVSGFQSELSTSPATSQTVISTSPNTFQADFKSSQAESLSRSETVPSRTRQATKTDTFREAPNSKSRNTSPNGTFVPAPTGSPGLESQRKASRGSADSTLAGRGLIGPVGSAFAFAVWKRRRAVHNISEEEDLTVGCIEVLGQFNKKLARLHYLLMFLGLPEKGNKKLQDELAANRRGCMEMCWHIRDNLFAKMTRAAMQGEATTYVRTLTDCLEMYVKELAILSHLYADTLLHTMQKTPSSSKKKGKTRAQKVHPQSNSKPDDVSSVVLDSERQEVMELLQMILNKLSARTEGEQEQQTSVIETSTTTTTTSAVVSVRKAVRPQRIFFCCDCFCTDDYR